ncbi:MAG TPA: aminotransferase class III-fold pyridoxal phosphate-dependent enzyme [Acetobacteraceae bacterium]|nr:aminotransferase class III-fold pyridoxal phosphate-dependent enzyme [Acetobacteraceae bacterium]
MDDFGRSNADLDSALAETREAYVARNPKSFARFLEATAVMPGGNTRSVLFYAPFPVALARGEGAALWDLDGARYIDFLGEYTAGIYGHSHPVIRRAVEAALDGGINLGGHNLLEARFARAVTERFGLERVRFTNSGTEANLMAVATAAAVTGRRKVMAFRGGYHGGVFTFSGNGSPVNAPYDFVLVRYNDTEGAIAAIEEEASALAAVIIEPMLGGGGCIPAEPAFLAAIVAAARKAGAISIFDEVMTSRLAPAGLSGKYGLRPDLVTLGKYVGGGMSFGAFGGRAELLDRFDPRRPDAFPHAGTFNNNVLTMSAGLAGITEVYTKDAAEALNARGEALRARLNALCRRQSAPMQFTGIGSMMTVHFTAAPIRAPEDWAEIDPRLKELFFFDVLAAGIWMARRGMINLSLVTGDAECERLFSAVEEFLQSRAALLGEAAARAA